jgi:tripartite-type tricarboxylate transporter receptor subunit TctC
MGSVRLALPVLAAGLVLAGPAHAEDFYAGKTISIVIGSGVGGAYDAMARTVGRRLADYIPGKPTIIFKNMPGAASRTAAAWLYNSAAKDGLSIGAISPQALLDPLFGDAAQLKYDPLKFEFIGSAASLAYSCVVRFDSPVQSFKEAQDKEVIMGTSAPGSAGYETTMILSRVLGAKFRLVTGYPNSPATAMAVEKGEINGSCGGMDQIAPHREFAAQNKLRVIVQFGLEPNARLTAMGAPMVWDFVRKDEDRKLLRLLMTAQTVGRPYVMPPGSPPEAVAIIRKAFDQAVKDPKFLEDAARATLEVAPVNAARMREILAESYGASPELIQRARQALQ